MGGTQPQGILQPNTMLKRETNYPYQAFAEHYTGCIVCPGRSACTEIL